MPASSGIKDIVHLKRLVDLAEPLDPVRRATPAAFVERQLELAQQICHLLPARPADGCAKSVVSFARRSNSLSNARSPNSRSTFRDPSCSRAGLNRMRICLEQSRKRERHPSELRSP